MEACHVANVTMFCLIASKLNPCLEKKFPKALTAKTESKSRNKKENYRRSRRTLELTEILMDLVSFYSKIRPRCNIFCLFSACR